MWICPKCGRSFRNENQHYFCGNKKADDASPMFITSLWT